MGDSGGAEQHPYNNVSAGAASDPSFTVAQYRPTPSDRTLKSAFPLRTPSDTPALCTVISKKLFSSIVRVASLNLHRVFAIDASDQIEKPAPIVVHMRCDHGLPPVHRQQTVTLDVPARLERSQLTAIGFDLQKATWLRGNGLRARSWPMANAGP